VLSPNQFCTTLFAISLLGTSVHAVVPYTQATVTRLQNKVTYGDAAGNARRAAASGDVIRAKSYLLTETDARVELKYVDGSIVRIGQNTVFTFEADTRTLSLEKGSLVFYIPKGQGGGTIKTASITAAITGTIGKVADGMIAILEGEVTLIPSGRKVPAGSFARANPDGTITIGPFDPAKAMGGQLMKFGGDLANFDETTLLTQPPTTNPAAGLLDLMDTLDRTGNHPGAQQQFLSPDVIRPGSGARVPPPESKPGSQNGQY
jgi:hypothetical protein